MNTRHIKRVGKDTKEPMFLKKSNKTSIEYWIYKGTIIFSISKSLEKKPYLYKTDIPGLESDSIHDIIAYIDNSVYDYIHYINKNAILTPFGHMYKVPCGVRIIANMNTRHHPFLSENYDEITCGYCKIIAKEEAIVEARKNPIL